MQPTIVTSSLNNKKNPLQPEHRTRLYQILSELDSDQLRLLLTTHLQNPTVSDAFQNFTREHLFLQCSVLIENYYSNELEQTLYAIRQKRFPSDYQEKQQQQQQNFSPSLNQQQQQQTYFYAQQSVQYNVQPNYGFPSTSPAIMQQLRSIRPNPNIAQSSIILNPRPQQQQSSIILNPRPQQQQQSSYMSPNFPHQQQTRPSPPPSTIVSNISSRPVIQRFQVPLLLPTQPPSSAKTPSPSSSSPHLTPILTSTNNSQRFPANQIIHKTLPFYRPITCIYERYQAFQYDNYRKQYFSHNEFLLSLDVCNQLALSYDYDPDFDTHKTSKCLLVRLVRIDRPPMLNGKYDDNLPPNLVVHVNSHNLTTLPIPKACTRRQNDLIRTGREIDITSHCMFNPTLKNDLTITWSYHLDNTNLHLQYVNAQYALHIFLVEHLAIDELCEQIIKKTARFFRDDLVKLLAKARANDYCHGLEVSDQKLKLICPIDQRRLKIPTRATTCQHLQCFDLKNYIALNEKSGKWTCPVCNKSALFDDLQIDSFTESILNAIQNENITEITINGDLQWVPVLQLNTNNEQNDYKSHLPLFSSSTDVILIDDD